MEWFVIDGKMALSAATSRGYVCFVLICARSGIAQGDSAAKAEMDKILSNLTSFYYHMEYGMEILKSKVVPNNPNVVNGSALFANGYCLGGQMVLELARRDANLMVFPLSMASLGT